MLIKFFKIFCLILLLISPSPVYSKNKDIKDDVELCEMFLEQVGLALVPGTAFGSPGYLRLSFACGLETLAEAMNRMVRFVKS